MEEWKHAQHWKIEIENWRIFLQAKNVGLKATNTDGLEGHHYLRQLERTSEEQQFMGLNTVVEQFIYLSLGRVMLMEDSIIIGRDGNGKRKNKEATNLSLWLLIQCAIA